MEAYQILCLILLTVLPVFVAAGIRYLFELVGESKLRKFKQELEAKQELALLAVRFAEQAFRDYGGQDKFNQAANWLAARAQGRGIAISEEEIKGLIESALRLIKDEFGEQWADIPANSV